MKILLASHISAFDTVVEWLEEQPGVELTELYRVEYIEDALETEGPFDLVLSSDTGRHLGMGDSPIETYTAPREYARRNNVPHIPLYRWGGRRSPNSIIRSARRLIRS